MTDQSGTITTIPGLRQPVLREDGRHMIAGSGLQAWDAQIGVLRPDEAVDRGYHTSLVHARTDTTESGDEFPVGYLRSEDLAGLGELPGEVFERVLLETETESLLLTQLRHWRREQATEVDQWERVVHGYVGTRPETYRFVFAIVTGPTHRSQGVVRFALPYLATDVPAEWGEAKSRRLFSVRWPDETTGELR